MDKKVPQIVLMDIDDPAHGVYHKYKNIDEKLRCLANNSFPKKIDMQYPYDPELSNVKRKVSNISPISNENS